MTKYSGQEIWEACKQAGFSTVPKGDDIYSPAQIMAAICLAESGGDTAATNKSSGAAGVFQILLSVHYREVSESCARSLECSAAFAKILYDRRGGTFGAWEAYTNKSYLKFLPLQGATGAAAASASPVDSPPSTSPTVDILGVTLAMPTAQEWQDAGVAAGVGLLALLLIGAAVWGFATGKG